MDPAKVQLSAEEMALVKDAQLILTKNSIIQRVIGLFADLYEEYKQVLEDEGGGGKGDGPGVKDDRIGAKDGVMGTKDEGRGEEGDRIRGEGDGMSAKVSRARLKDDGMAEDGPPVRRIPGGDSDHKKSWARAEEDGRVGYAGGRIGKISKGENYQGLPYVMLDFPRVFGREDVLAIRTMFWWGHYFSVTLHLKGKYRELYLPAIRDGLPALAAAGFHLGIGDDEWRHELTTDNYRRLGEADDDRLGEMSGDVIEEILTGHPFLKLSARYPLDKWHSMPELLLGLFQVLVNILRAGG